MCNPDTGVTPELCRARQGSKLPYVGLQPEAPTRATGCRHDVDSKIEIFRAQFWAFSLEIGKFGGFITGSALI